jgi:hypothetical protein
MSHTCSICLDEIDVASTGQVTLACGHHNHLGCISKWFYNQEKSSCPLCRTEMEGVADVWVDQGEEDEDSEDEDDETESTLSEGDERRIPDYISFNCAEFNAMLVEYGLRPVPADKWFLFTQTYMVMTPEFPGELRVRMWRYDMENFFLGRGEKALSTEMWELIVDRQKVGVTDAFLSATYDFSHPLRLPNEPTQLRVTVYQGGARYTWREPAEVQITWHLMDTGVWQRWTMNPEEDTGISTTTPVLADNSATKIQAVWRGFQARMSRAMTAA